MEDPHHHPRTGDALLIVDVQADFLPGGALAVADGDRVVAPLAGAAAGFAARGLPVVATRDWHPPDHCSFHAQGGPWPPHCVRDTPGARFPDGLGLPDGAVVVSKATRADAEAYSGFAGTELERVLAARGVERLFVGGLATDFCVLQTVLDARDRGFTVVLLTDAVRPVELHPGDGDQALARMRRRGVRFASAASLAA